MKRLVVKSAFAISCIVAASVSGFKAYEQHIKNVADANMLLAENVEALCQPEDEDHRVCDVPADPKSCWANANPSDFRGISWTYTKKVNSYGTCLCMGQSRSCPPGSSVK